MIDVLSSICLVSCKFIGRFITLFNNPFKRRSGRKVEPSSGTPRPLGPQYLKIPWTLGTLRTSGSLDPLWPQDPLEITSTIWNSESQHPETLKLKHNKRTFLNYIIGQSENCVNLMRLFYLSRFYIFYIFMIISGQSPPLLPSPLLVFTSSHL